MALSQKFFIKYPGSNARLVKSVLSNGVKIKHVRNLTKRRLSFSGSFSRCDQIARILSLRTNGPAIVVGGHALKCRRNARERKQKIRTVRRPTPRRPRSKRSSFYSANSRAVSDVYGCVE